jgi:transposase-like protein
MMRAIHPLEHPRVVLKEEILRAYQEHSSLRGIERIFGVLYYTVAEWLKKGS